MIPAFGQVTLIVKLEGQQRDSNWYDSFSIHHDGKEDPVQVYVQGMLQDHIDQFPGEINASHVYFPDTACGDASTVTFTVQNYVKMHTEWSIVGIALNLFMYDIIVSLFRRFLTSVAVSRKSS